MSKFFNALLEIPTLLQYHFQFSSILRTNYTRGTVAVGGMILTRSTGDCDCLQILLIAVVSTAWAQTKDVERPVRAPQGQQIKYADIDGECEILLENVLRKPWLFMAAQLTAITVTTHAILWSRSSHCPREQFLCDRRRTELLAQLLIGGQALIGSDSDRGVSFSTLQAREAT